MMKKGLIAFGVLFLLLIIVPLSSAQAAERTISSPVYLKINDYYILYTTPTPPFIDKQNRLLIPLRTVSDLLGAKVTYDSRDKTAVIEFGSETVQLTVGSKEVNVNGKILEMDTVPVMIKQSMFIPAKVLIEAFNLVGEWDSTNHILTLRDDRFISAEIEDYKERTLKVSPVSDHTFVPQSFELQYRISEIESGGDILSWLDQKISVKMKNTEKKNFSAEEVDIHVVTSITDSFFVDRQYNEAIEAEEIFVITFGGGSGGSWKTNDIKFIAVFSRLLQKSQ